MLILALRLNRIKGPDQTHIRQKFGRQTQGLSVWFGDFESSNFRIDSKNGLEVLRSVEGLLIYRNQPILNEQCKGQYTGLLELRVLSHSLPLLKAKIETPRT